MKIAIIGTGNVSQVLGKMLLNAGHTILQVCGRNEISVKQVAALVQARPVTNSDDIDKSADVCLIAVSDSAVGTVATLLQLPDTIILHTSGALSKEVLQGHQKYGVLYPLQSMRKELPYLPEIPFLIDGSSKDVTASVHSLAQSVSPEVHYAGDNERLKLHIAAVMAATFSNHLFALTKNFL